MREWVEIGMRFKDAFEGETPLFQQLDVGFAIFYQLFLEVVDGRGLCNIPGVEFSTFGDGHDIGHKVTLVWNRSLIILVFRSVEEVRKEALFKFDEAKGFWKGRQKHGKKRKRVNEGDTIMHDP